MTNIMIYTPSLSGHRQLASGIITNIYLNLGCRVFLLIPFKYAEDITKWRHINQFVHNSKVTLLSSTNISKDNNGNLSAEEIGNLQQQYRIDLTIFEEGDFFIDQFVRLSENCYIKRYGKNAAIFTRTSSWFPGENPYTGELINNTLFKQSIDVLKNVLSSKGKYLTQRKQKPSYFFPRIIIKERVLSAALMADERIPEFFGSPFIWMPTMYKSFTLTESADDRKEFSQEKEKYDNFLLKNQDKKVLLYFGTSRQYKGYSKMLALALKDKEACFVHCGRLTDDIKNNVEIDHSKRSLEESNRIFETKKYIKSQKLVEYFFNSAEHIVSTHNFLGPSGTMIQAIQMGKSILTPDKGLIGYRTKSNNLGMTYLHNNQDDLMKKWIDLNNSKKGQYSLALDKYKRYFTKEAFVGIYKSIL